MAKYPNRQRVKIKVRDQHGNVKYPRLQRYENETGTVIASEWLTRIVSVAGLEKQAPGAFYLYTVQLDNGVILKDVPEDALHPLDNAGKGVGYGEHQHS